MSSLFSRIYTCWLPKILQTSLFVLMAGLFLGAGCAAQKCHGRRRLVRGVFYLLCSILLLGIFVAGRWLSSPNGLIVFFSLFTSLYLIYWLDVIHCFKHCFKTNELRGRGKRLYLFSIMSASILVLIIINSAALTGYRIYHIPSVSMMPTLIPGDYVLVDQWAYQEKSPRKGDVIVFQHPYNQRSYIKRIAYLPSEEFMGKFLAEDHFAVLGDNTDRSEDSRFFGGIKAESMVGKACCIVFSLHGQLGFNTDRFLGDVVLINRPSISVESHNSL